MTEDRREQERFSLGLQAKLTFRHVSEPSPVMEMVAANISSGGAFLQTVHDIPLAAKVLVEFLLDLDDLYRLKFILSTDDLRRLDTPKIWVKATAFVIRREAKGIAVIFAKDYQLSALER